MVYPLLVIQPPHKRSHARPAASTAGGYGSDGAQPQTCCSSLAGDNGLHNGKRDLLAALTRKASKSWPQNGFPCHSGDAISRNTWKVPEHNINSVTLPPELRTSSAFTPNVDGDEDQTRPLASHNVCAYVASATRFSRRELFFASCAADLTLGKHRGQRARLSRMQTLRRPPAGNTAKSKTLCGAGWMLVFTRIVRTPK
jgi:hypothetical protein